MKLRAWPALTRAIALAVVLLAMSLSVVGRGKQPAGAITEAASTAVEPVSERLAGEYVHKHPGVQVVTGSGGTAVGITFLRTRASPRNV